MQVRETDYRSGLISVDELDVSGILRLFECVRKVKEGDRLSGLQGKTMASLFFEPSTRTRLSFEVAAHRLGMHVIGLSDPEMTAMKKGETLSDALRVISGYADLIVLRHPLEGAARLAANVAGVPVINAGDGGHEHPTQTLVDLFSIYERRGSLENMSIGMTGDLKYGRTAHSLALAAALFGMRIYFISGQELRMPDHICHALRRRGVKFSHHDRFEDVLSKLDVLYVTRIQRERHGDEVAPRYRITLRKLAKAKPDLMILHPLPRERELDLAIDDTKYAHYFTQSENGPHVRQALLSFVLRGEEEI